MQKSLFSRVITAVRHHSLIVAVIIGAGCLAALLAAMSSHPKYAAVTSVLMVAGSSDAPGTEAVATPKRPLLPADLPSLAAAATVLGRVRADIGETAPVEAMRSRIKAKVSAESTIMTVEYTAATPQKAIAGANALGDEITRFYRDLATTRFDSLISDLKTQLRARRLELLKFDGELADISKRYPYIDVKTPGSAEYSAGSVYQRLIALRTERDELEATLHADAAIAGSTGRLVANAKPIAMREVLQNDPVYARVREQYAKDLAELKRVSAYGSDRYPGLVELRRTVAHDAAAVAAAQRQAERQGPAADLTYGQALDARTRAQGQVASDEAKLAEESLLLDQLHDQIGRRSIATEAAQLRRDHDNAEAAYAIIASRLANSIGDRAEAASTGSLVVLERAQFASQSSVGVAWIVAVCLVCLSVWMALTVALMIDGSQQWFNENETIETVYGAPVIGSVV
jgi:capsular polysaccharide biosynthesis protein